MPTDNSFPHEGEDAALAMALYFALGMLQWALQAMGF